MVSFATIVNVFYLRHKLLFLCEKAPSQMFDRILNTPLDKAGHCTISTLKFEKVSANAKEFVD